MNFDSVVGIAEIVSGICVVASLVYVGRELRKNNIQSRLDNWSSQVDRFVKGEKSSMTDYEILDLIEAASRPSITDELEYFPAIASLYAYLLQLADGGALLRPPLPTQYALASGQAR